MRKTIMAVCISAFATISAYADEPPKFFKDTYPENAVEAAWSEFKAVYGANGAIPPKMKQLIALGVAAQIPCQYCVVAHGTKARKAGATEAEIKEALAVASLVRKWSTVLNGYSYDMDKFRAEIGAPTN